MTTIPRPTLGDVTIKDEHERTVVVQLDGTEPFATDRLRGSVGGSVAVRFQPQTLRLTWRGVPPQLHVVSIAGPELTKSGKPNMRGVIIGYSYISLEWEYETRSDSREYMVSRYSLDDDTPDWVRELIARYAPDWSGLGWNDESRTPEENEKTIATLLKAADEWEARS